MRMLGYVALGIFLYWVYSHPDEALDNLARAIASVRAGVKAAEDEYNDKAELDRAKREGKKYAPKKLEVLDPYPDTTSATDKPPEVEIDQEDE